MRYVVAALVGLSLTLSTTVHAQEVMQLGPVLVVTVVDAKPERAGAGQQLFMADRGGRKGQYVVVTSSATNLQAAGTTSTVYNLLSPKTVPTLPQVDVLGMHYLKIRPERSEAFERFVAEKLHPTVGNLRPDLRVLYYKAVKGADAGNYVALFALTKVSRDKYWPGGSDSDDAQGGVLAGGQSPDHGAGHLPGRRLLRGRSKTGGGRLREPRVDRLCVGPKMRSMSTSNYQLPTSKRAVRTVWVKSV